MAKRAKLRPHEVQNLLRRYRELRAYLYNEQRELERINSKGPSMVGSPENYMLALALGNMLPVDPDQSFRGGSSSIFGGDRETSAVMNYDRLMGDEWNRSKKELIEECIEIGSVVEKISAGILGLSQQEREVVTMFYVEDMAWKEICGVVPVGERRAQEIRDDGIRKLRRLLPITYAQYNYCLKQVTEYGTQAAATEETHK